MSAAPAAAALPAEVLAARLGVLDEWLSPLACRYLLRALSRPHVTSDALLQLADMAEEAAGVLTDRPEARHDFEHLARMLREVAPHYADAPLPGPEEDALPPEALRAAALVLGAHGGFELAGVSRLLSRMAVHRDAPQDRRGAA